MDNHIIMDVSQITGGTEGIAERIWFHKDERGNIIAISNNNGIILERYKYKVYGDYKVMDASFVEKTTEAISPFLWGGSLYEPESDLYWMRNRYYSKEMKRFINVDPLGIWGDANNLGNGFAYVAGMVVEAKDPTGLISGYLDYNEDFYAQPIDDEVYGLLENYGKFFVVEVAAMIAGKVAEKSVEAGASRFFGAKIKGVAAFVIVFGSINLAIYAKFEEAKLNIKIATVTQERDMLKEGITLSGSSQVKLLSNGCSEIRTEGKTAEGVNIEWVTTVDGEGNPVSRKCYINGVLVKTKVWNKEIK